MPNATLPWPPLAPGTLIMILLLSICPISLKAPAAGGELTYAHAMTYPLEASMDELEAHWPTAEGPLDELLRALEDLPATLRDVYANALEVHHGYHPESWSWRTTPQRLASRIARIVSPMGRMSPWDPDVRPHFVVPPSRMPRFPEYFGVQCLSPIPERPALWCDFIVIRQEAPRAHAARYDEYDTLREFVLISWGESGWRALHFTWQPDGSRARLHIWEEGPRLARRVQWDPRGEAHEVLYAENGAGDYVTCTIEISFAPPEGPAYEVSPAQRLLPVPAAGLYHLPAGVPVTIAAPPLSLNEFTGWSGDASGQFDQLAMQPDRDLRLVANYRWMGRMDAKALYLLSKFEPDQSRQKSAISTADLARITSLDLSATQFSGLEFLRYLPNLRHVDLSGAPVPSIYPLSAHAAFEESLRSPTWPGNSDLLNKVLFALHAGTAAPVTSLKMNNTTLSSPEELAYLSQLKSLELRRSELVSIDFAAGLPDLETLDLRENNVFDLTPISAALPNLKTLRVADNKISDISALLERARWPEDASIALEGNALPSRAICEDIPKLTARGVTVSHDGDCEGSRLPRDDVDADGDGYSDLEEWTFVSLFSADEAERKARFAEAIADPAIPSAYLSLAPGAVPDSSGKIPLSVIPTTEITLHVKGQGTVNPGPGTHRFAHIVYNPDSTWDFNRVTLTPVPAPGWEVIPLHASHLEYDLLTRAESGDGIVIYLHTPTSIHFEFTLTRHPLNIDLVDALIQFVALYYPDEDPYLFDRNDLTFHAGNVQRPAPNGIPDAAEFRLLQAILQDPSLNHQEYLGLSFDEAMDIWETNLPIAVRALGDAAENEPYLAHVLSAYATLGGWYDREAAVAMIRESKGISIGSGQFRDGLSIHLSPKKTFHNGATFNEDLWARVRAGRAVDRAVIDAYAELVLSQPPY